MPDRGKATGQDLVGNVIGRLDRLEREARALLGGRIATVDRAYAASVPAPTEGQMIVEATTEALSYYSNGEWRRV